ncbi:MAG: hypothetical protein K1X89_28950, partial [Myxococcaceae bacterium]|nr:hypothetical protein [Myxococcaceae bacterium]
KLKARAAVAHAPRPGDAPTVTTLTPGPSGLPADGELTGASTGSSLAAPIAVTALTGAAAIATVALVVVASGARSQYEAAKVTDNGSTGTTLTRAEADALAGKANGCFSAALGTGIATGVGAVLSGVLWATHGESESE